MLYLPPQTNDRPVTVFAEETSNYKDLEYAMPTVRYQIPFLYSNNHRDTNIKEIIISTTHFC